MQKIGVHYIEDCLEILTGLQKHDFKFHINSSDATIINSIARQVFKGTALTDRQYALMKSKLLENYLEQFEKNGISDLERAVTKTRKELRSVDRSKYIKIVDDAVDYLHALDKKGKFIKIKFPFSKSLILKIERCVSKIKSSKYYHKKGSHEHYFVFDEHTTKTIVEEFQSSEFEIDKEIMEFYSKIKEIADNVHLNLPVIMNNTLFVNDNLKKTIEQDTSLDFRKIVDRHRRYGLINLQSSINSDCLHDNIAFRNEVDFFCDPSKVSIEQVAESIGVLDRFPLLVVIQEGKEEEQLYAIHNAFKNLVPNQNQSVLFRLEGESKFNSYVKDNNLNNWVDNTTKIVYIQNNKLPKVLLKTDWSPITAMVFDLSARFYRRHVQYYIHNSCDLVVIRSDNEYQKKMYKQYNDNV